MYRQAPDKSDVNRHSISEGPLSMELASFLPSGTQNLELVPRFFGKFVDARFMEHNFLVEKLKYLRIFYL